MAIITPPPFLQGGSHSAKSTRQLVSALSGQAVQTFVNSVGAVGPAHGLVTTGDLAVVQNGTPNMSVNVGIGRAFISGGSSLAQGAYAFTNDATVNLAIATADATNPRRDLVCAQVRDNTEDASGFNDARLFVVTGTPAASPVDPAPPAGTLVLARVTVAALAASIVNANITTVALKVSTKLTEQTDRLACLLQKSVAQSIPNSVNTTVTYDVELFDVGGLHDNVTNNTRITVPTGGGGLWQFGYQVSWDNGAVGYREHSIQKNGNPNGLCGASGSPGYGFNLHSGAGIFRMVPGDYCEVWTTHTQGAALTVRANASLPGLTAFYAYRLGD